MKNQAISSVKWILYESWHFDVMLMPDHVRDQVVQFDLKRRIALKPGEVVVRSCLIDHTIKMIAGVNLLWPHVGQLWTYHSVDFDQTNMIHFRTMSNKMLDYVMSKFQLHRIEAYTQCGDVGERFSKIFKFISEGPLHKYDSEGNDYIRLARLM